PSHEKCSLSARIRKENACPTQVLISSTKSSSFCMTGRVPPFGGGESLSLQYYRRLTATKKTPSGDRMVSLERVLASGFLCGRFRAEVIVVRHAPVHVGVEVPTHRAFGEFLLRFDDLDEQRVVLPLRHHVVEDFELFLQDRIR